MTKILVVDDKQMLRDSVTTTLVRSGYQAVAASDGEAALSMIARHRPSVVVTDLKMPGMDGIELLKRIVELDPQLPVILMTAYATIDTAVSAMKRGAFDYIQKPFEGDTLIVAVERAVENYRLRTENEALLVESNRQIGPRKLIGTSDVMENLRRQIAQVAGSDGTVMICGESGTGKEIVAQMIHALSFRHGQILLCVNCAALSSNLLESELFGHEKGAFTGADQLRKGRFELAQDGTLLLDEVSEMETGIQAKLLRVLQERQFERVGSSVTMDANVRVIATTNRDLERAVSDGTFRQDLYFRLNVLPIYIPPLRDRKEDISELADHFLVKQALRDGRTPRQFSDAAINVLMGYDWPGNVRELENICERAGVLSLDEVISADLVCPWLGGMVASEKLAVPLIETKTLEEVERDVIIAMLARFSGHRQRTASALGIGVRTLGLKLRRWKELDIVSQSL